MARVTYAMSGTIQPGQICRTWGPSAGTDNTNETVGLGCLVDLVAGHPFRNKTDGPGGEPAGDQDITHPCDPVGVV